MRVVKVDPGEKLRRADGFEPLERMVRNFVAASLDAAEGDAAILREIEVVEVLLEPLRDSPFVVQHVCADEATRPESPALEAFGHRGLAVAQEKAAVIAHPVRRRQLAGEERRV